MNDCSVTRRRHLAVATLFALALASVAVHAQDDADADVDADAVAETDTGTEMEAAAESGTGGDSDAATVDTTLAPRPAVAAPRAASGLLLGVARAGGRYVAVGQRGIVLVSDDGTRWKQVAAPVDATLTRVQFVDERKGWAVGYDGTILHSADGGETWSLQQFDPEWGGAYYDVRFRDASTGFALGGNGRLLRTRDGGANWEPLEPEVFAEQPNLYNLVLLGDGSILVTGERGLIARSGDDGENWTQLKSPYTGSFFGTVAVGARGAVIFGLRGNAFHAADLDAAAPLSEADRAALLERAMNPEASSATTDPVSEVAGWRELKTEDVESLYGGTLDGRGQVLLFGGNGRVMRADLEAGRLVREALPTNANFNSGLATDDALIVVGTSGVQRHARR